MKLISVVSPCFNEEDNVEECYRQVRAMLKRFPQFSYEHIFIDNNSQDNTVNILKRLAAQDKNLKIIVNSRNFGHLRPALHAFFCSQGDAVIVMASDLQDPPALIPELISKWEQGFKVVKAVKKNSQESFGIKHVRKIFYIVINRLSEVELTKNFNGYGLYDRIVIEAFKTINDPYPFLRGLASEVGYPQANVEFVKPGRRHGITKNNFYTLYDVAMLGIVNHSKIPLRLTIFLGFFSAGVSFMVGLIYLTYKLLNWETFQVGIAPLVIGVFFMMSVILIFLGIIGEYVGAILTQVQRRPLVFEKERINFD